MNGTIQIESGIEIPSAARGRKSTMRYPFRKMNVGDSFVIQQNGGGKLGLERHRIYAYYLAKRARVKITTRKVETGIRVWKIA